MTEGKQDIVERLRAYSEDWRDRAGDNAVVLEAADTITSLLEALEFYADRDGDGYDVMVTDYGLSTETGEIIQDRGERAQAAIAKVKP
jgi:flagellin-like hook-associated protein FlgL